MDYPLRSDLGLGADDGVLEVREPSAVYGAVGAGVGVGGFGGGAWGQSSVLEAEGEDDEEAWLKWEESLPEVEYPEEFLLELDREVEATRALLAAGQLKIYKSAEELIKDLRENTEK